MLKVAVMGGGSTYTPNWLMVSLSARVFSNWMNYG